MSELASRQWAMRITGRGRTRRLCPLLAGASSGQALPLALIALAIGAVLVTPFLTHVSVNLLASRRAEESIADYYSADAGIEWGLWRLKNDPTLTTNTSYDEAPLQPTPVSVNGASFPTTEIRFVSGVGASETITPTWQSGDGEKCYPFTTTDAGLIFAVVETTDADSVWVTLLSESASCVKPGGLEPLSGTSPYTVQFGSEPAGSYQILVETDPASSGTLTIIYPIASYDLRSERDGRTITTRATASTNAVTIISWQLG
jgi:hypothetical protein